MQDISYHLTHIGESGEVQLSESIRKIRIPSDNCDDQGVLMYNLDTARSKTKHSYLILTSSLKV